MDDDPELCPQCGSKLEVLAAISSPAQDDVIEKILHGRKTIALLTTAVGLGALLVAGVVLYRPLEAANSFDEMLTAVDAVCGGHEVNTDTLSYVKRVLGSTW